MLAIALPSSPIPIPPISAHLLHFAVPSMYTWRIYPFADMGEMQPCRRAMSSRTNSNSSS